MASSWSEDEIFTAMGQAAENDENLKKKFKACAVFVVDGTTYCLDSKTGTLSTDIPNNVKVDLTVTTSLSVLQQLLEKKMTPQQAFMKGKLKIKGNMSLAMKLTIVLSATRKYLTPTTSKL